MRWIIWPSILVLLLPVLLGGDGAIAATDQAINREWLAKDIKHCDRVKTILPVKPTTFADFYAAMHAIRPGSDPKPPSGRDIGYSSTHLFQF